MSKKNEYEKYVKTKTPLRRLWPDMLRAFIVGGGICLIGQFILNYCEKLGLDKETSGGWCSMLLVLLSVILTGFGIYPQIANWGGAGALVPITGFANSVAAPAIEYKKDESDIIGLSQKDLIDQGRVWRFSLT